MFTDCLQNAARSANKSTSGLKNGHKSELLPFIFAQLGGALGSLQDKAFMACGTEVSWTETGQFTTD
jgi:hypothetical protein